ncbi:acyl-CoA dehydrogenase [Limnobacter humi]|uniref:Acyl-coenzyme A dehydrogenase n=1 Tax=Limnobacter humi TaxID=1778671 RepID=A0ABT1WJ72_9BURK|nr:acyl-CoA dehydrogenase [Limnobacter humi]MCQ8897560.1 acyl-CoA dehydrogenase [Limnobacter humi]
MVFKAVMNGLIKAKAMPQISATERQALEAGTVWIDGQVFSGKPDFAKMFAEPYSKLNARERAFVDGPVQELCTLFDPHEVATTRVIPPAAIDFLAKKGFYSFLIPQAYGGLEFSANAISTIMAMLTSYSPLLSTLVVIPNSLGAAELIKHYGTQGQKDHYLPKLATGEYLPCFGLTEPTAGSDAASILARGVAFKNAEGKVQIKLNFRKRYITLAPVANLISLAFKLHDPQNLLGKGEDAGITVALVHRGTPGLEMGKHHQPIGDAFYNGPIVGNDVVIDADEIIGGKECAGQGWRMLMEQLAGGRAVSLPAGAVGGVRAAAAAAGAYAKVRQQFGMPIAEMEGVQEKLAEIAAMAYLAEGSRIYALSALDNGEQPPVVSAVWKAYLTELSREQAKNAMDVMAGAGVMQGPNNIIGRGYCSAPVAITVEGANIMTRSLITFGQGAVRCHPYAFKIANALEANDLPTFSSALKGWIGHMVTNTLRLIGMTATRGALASVPQIDGVTPYLKKLAWASTRYAYLTDMALINVGGKLKARQQLTGHFADALAWQLMAISTIRRYIAEGEIKEDLPLVQYAVEYSLEKVQRAFEAIYANFGNNLLGKWMRTVGYFGLRMSPLVGASRDRLVPVVAKTITKTDAQSARILGDLAMPKIDLAELDSDEVLARTKGVKRLMAAFQAVQAADVVQMKILQARRAKLIDKGSVQDMAAAALAKGIITAADKVLLDRANRLSLEAIMVDEFTPAEFFGKEGVTYAPGFECANVPNVGHGVAHDAPVEKLRVVA